MAPSFPSSFVFHCFISAFLQPLREPFWLIYRSPHRTAHLTLIVISSQTLYHYAYIHAAFELRIYTYCIHWLRPLIMTPVPFFVIFAWRLQTAATRGLK
jgi:hypothetical protein